LHRPTVSRGQTFDYLRKKCPYLNNPGVVAVHLTIKRKRMISAGEFNGGAPANCAGGPLCSLNSVRAGTCVRIKQLPEGAELTTRLREIGFCEEQTIRLVSAKNSVICQVCNSRLAISTQLAAGILVEPLSARAA
jgi:Fe2+ transport system protein FeoA